MNFAFSEEQEELKRFVRQFLEEKSPETTVRELMATENGYDKSVWDQMASQMGLQGLIIPEEYGGQGFSYIELVLVLEEMGRALLCAPFFATVALATNALLLGGSEEAKQVHLPDIASGSTIATLAFTEENGRWDEAGIQMEATQMSDSASDNASDNAISNIWQLSGVKSFVLDGHTADLILVAARTPQGIGLFSCPGDAEGLIRTPLSTMDQTRKQAKLEFNNTPVELIGDLDASSKSSDSPPDNSPANNSSSNPETLDRVLDLAAVALAAEQVGGAQMCLDMSVEYAKTRIQFGRPIGSFQAIKHKCADMLMEVESAKSAAYYAGWCASELNEELPSVASLAKSYCSEAYFHASAENIQIHGGIGFTWEHPAHLYFKRAKSSELLFGDPTYHRELLAQRIGI